MLPLPLGAFLAGLEVGPVGAMVFFVVLGRFEGGDLGMQLVGLGVDMWQIGARVGQPKTVDGATDGILEGTKVSSKDVG